MEPSFWLERWARNETGFHLATVNPRLLQYWPSLALPAGSRVLVPLAGKTVDLSWLREQGYEVLAIELSEIAVQAFYTAAGLEPERREEAWGVRYAAAGITYLVADFFALEPATTGRIDAVYDRGALVALPEPLRARYAERLTARLAPGVPTLLVTLDYDQRQMNGPPFAVGRPLVEGLYAATHEIELLLDEDILPDEPRFAARGVSRLHGLVWRLRRRG